MVEKDHKNLISLDSFEETKENLESYENLFQHLKDFLAGKLVEEVIEKKPFAPDDEFDADITSYHIIIKRIEEYIK